MYSTFFRALLPVIYSVKMFQIIDKMSKIDCVSEPCDLICPGCHSWYNVGSLSQDTEFKSCQRTFFSVLEKLQLVLSKNAHLIQKMFLWIN